MDTKNLEFVIYCKFLNYNQLCMKYMYMHMFISLFVNMFASFMFLLADKTDR